jgi:hypothetical protein
METSEKLFALDAKDKSRLQSVGFQPYAQIRARTWDYSALQERICFVVSLPLPRERMHFNL